VLDVGAGFGLYSLPAAAQGARVFSFEPTRQREILKQSFRMNPAWPAWLILPFCCWDGGTDFPEPLQRELFSRDQPEPLNLKTLDEVVFAVGLDRVDRIKIDVEGAELGVLLGARSVLRQHRPRLIIELHDGCYDYADEHEIGRRVADLLTEQGYALEREEEPGRRRDGGPGTILIATP
jgi:FkbM family methyltransferase